ncbi:MAG: class I SAM-dependent methyltransferase [Chthoniobacterales bacterium]
MSTPLENYFRLMTANGAVRIYHAAWKHGIIETLAREPMTLPALAQATRLNETALRLLVDGLLALGIVEHSEGTLRAGGVMQALSGGYRSLGDEYWAHLDNWLETGTPIRRMDSRTEGEAAYREQAAALAWMMAPAAAQAAELLAPLLPRDAVILDIGAGTGVWSLALAARLTESKAILLDRAGVLEVARQFTARAGLESRVEYKPGDYREAEIPAGSCDLAMIANVCHLETDAGNRALIARTQDWLKPGGRIVIIDVSAQNDPLTATLYALGLALRTESAAVPEPARIESWLSEIGFENVTAHSLTASPGIMQVWTAVRA